MKKIFIFILAFAVLVCTLSIAAVALNLLPYTLYSFEEYQQFIEDNNLPDDFVYYESISMFGEFQGLVFIGMFYEFSGDVENYSYYFKTKNNDSISAGGNSLTICKDYDDYNKYLDYDKTEVDTENLLSYKGREDYFVLDDAIYLYDGRLKAIKWENDGKLFTLWLVEGFEFSPDSIVGKLLNKSTAPEVIEMLKNYNFTGKPDEPIPPETADVSVIFPILGIISAGGFTLFAMKKRKK